MYASKKAGGLLSAEMGEECTALEKDRGDGGAGGKAGGGRSGRVVGDTQREGRWFSGAFMGYECQG